MAARLLFITDLENKPHFINVNKILYVTKSKTKGTELALEGNKIVTTLTKIEEVTGEINSIIGK
jgi:hypothetical protein